MSALPSLAAYGEVAGKDVIEHLRQLARRLKGIRVVHVNSTRVGGGVAEILNRLIPLMNELGVNATWEVIEGTPEFFAVTKSFHNGIQGFPVNVSEKALRIYEEVSRHNAERLRDQLLSADVVFIHDPQPARMMMHLPERKGKWIWRCHVDVSRPHRPVWKYLREVVKGYDASIFSLADFAQQLPHPQYLIPPSIDPLSAKNVELPAEEVRMVMEEFGLDPSRPLLVQVSRFDRFKDPIGVIEAYKLVRQYFPVQLALAGGTAVDDPEGAAVLAEVEKAAEGDPDIKILLLPPDADRAINALQRAAVVVVQKSIKEGFGLTVTEAMWKGKPVIGGHAGGIKLQVANYHTGFLVHSPEGAALRIRYLLNHPELIVQMGVKARSFVREHFLLTRHLREYLTLMVSLIHGDGERIVLR
ncbi:MAG TPA: glycosyltransferase [bacterium]|nr:glycosyltransferase [bacterium]